MLYAIIILSTLGGIMIWTSMRLKKLEKEAQNSEVTKNIMEILREHSAKIEYLKENFVEKESTPQIVEWIDNEGIYPIDLYKEEELKKTKEYNEAIKARCPLFVEFYNKTARGVFDLSTFSKAEKAKERVELSKFYENQPPWRKINKDGTVTYLVPKPGEKAYKKYAYAAQKKTPKHILLSKNGVLSPIFF